MAINDISLTAGMRSNLTSLQGTVSLLNRTQQRLSSGKAVNTALDNAINFFAAQSLNNRAADLAGFKDGMSNAIQTVQAANQGITTLTSLISSAKAVASSANGLSAIQSGSKYQTDTLTFSNVKSGDTVTIGTSTFTAIDATSTSVGSTQFKVGTTDAGTAMNFASTIASVVSQTGNATDTNGTPVIGGSGTNIALASFKGNVVTLTSSSTDITSSKVYSSSSISNSYTPGIGASAFYKTDAITVSNVKAGDTLTIGSSTFTAVAATATSVGSTQFKVGTTDSQTALNLFNSIQSAVSQTGNATDSVTGTPVIGGTANNISVKSLNGNVLTLSSSSTDIKTSAVFGSSSLAGTILPSESSNAALTSAVNQYQNLLKQIDTVADDSSFQGVNLLNNQSQSALVVNFGGGHSLSIAGFDATSSGLGLSSATNGWQSSADITGDTAKLDKALTTLQTQSSSMSNSLSIVQARQDFSTQLGNVLTTGSDNLTLADTNQEGANMLMLQTRQSLGVTALSLSSQAAQSVLRLF